MAYVATSNFYPRIHGKFVRLGDNDYNKVVVMNIRAYIDTYVECAFQIVMLPRPEPITY